jgi:hypothetical protein
VTARQRPLLLLGGAGVFDSRIARLLTGAIDTEILIAGRTFESRNDGRRVAGARRGGAAGRDRAPRERAGWDAPREQPALLIDASGPFLEIRTHAEEGDLSRGAPPCRCA